MTPAERSRVQQTFNERGGTAARHRRRIRRPQPPSPVPYRHSLRAAVESGAARAAGRTRRSIGQARRVHELALVAAHTAERLVLAPLVDAALRLDQARREPACSTRLTESRVAAAVMTAAEPASVGHRRARTRFRRARGVADRSRRSRRARGGTTRGPQKLAARSCRGRELDDRRPRPSCRRSRARRVVPRGLFLVFALALVNADGSHLSRRACLVRVDFSRTSSGISSISRDACDRTRLKESWQR